VKPPPRPGDTDGRPITLATVKAWYDVGDRTVQLIVHDAGRARHAIANLVGASTSTAGHRRGLGVLGPLP
jgi:hypothetical protein